MLPSFHMWTKLRPFVHRFLEQASNMFEMYVYTMGERAYALAMAQLLDPSGRYFKGRVISKADSTHRNIKDLDVVLSAESAVVILDDTEGVWPRHRDNLIVMERYHFFTSSCRHFGLESSLSREHKDESESEGGLATALKVLHSVHETFFHDFDQVREDCIGSSDPVKDVRQVIPSLRAKILMGCRIVFSRIFPVGLANPESHPLWQLAEALGAQCVASIDDSVTHVVALDRGTDKARWAKQNGRFLVHPSWIDAAYYRWCCPHEEDFPVADVQTKYMKLSFSKTVDICL
ncbi:hypothetical protein O6H91_16G063600 [Diphasiastrum complanatum]|nr:hypothetical protein O6H91_16G063600 [Diphasiastrum complanatum]